MKPGDDDVIVVLYSLLEILIGFFILGYSIFLFKNLTFQELI